MFTASCRRYGADGPKEYDLREDMTEAEVRLAPEKDADSYKIPKESSPDITPDRIHSLARVFLDHEGIHTYTSAAHLAILARGDGVLCIREDISRHCAIDKVVGYAVLNGTDLNECMIYTSGRVQEDTVKKLVNARIPVLISKSAPTLKAVELADGCGITLIGRAWPDGYEVYTAPAGEGKQEPNQI